FGAGAVAEDQRDGAEVRGVTGITVFSGMLGVTLFGLFLTPVFYVTLRRLVARKAQPQTA
ncbi:efflux RND transporter permease subunit, partial [Serratia bockelmannii]|uniref:efflux RND transporter permease subunit n=1 Tax=Serratia bockelmannii TaxID=2703793 RepID=UPI003D05F7E5